MTEREDEQDRARQRVEEIELRLGGLFDAFGVGLQQIADRMEPLRNTIVERGGSVGTVDAFVDNLTAASRPAPEHTITLIETRWSLEASLPDTRFADIRIDMFDGRLLLQTPSNRLVCALPADLDDTALEMSFQSGKLMISAPRSGGAI